MTLHPQEWKLKNVSRRTSPPLKTSNGGGGSASPDNTKGNKEVQVFPESREDLAPAFTGCNLREAP